jgi:hypothetical protein
MRVGDLKRGLLLRCTEGWAAYAPTGMILKLLPTAILSGMSTSRGPGHDGIMMFLGVRDQPPPESMGMRSPGRTSRWYEVLHATGVWCIPGREFRHIEPLDCEVNENV